MLTMVLIGCKWVKHINLVFDSPFCSYTRGFNISTNSSQSVAYLSDSIYVGEVLIVFNLGWPVLSCMCVAMLREAWNQFGYQKLSNEF